MTNRPAMPVPGREGLEESGGPHHTHTHEIPCELRILRVPGMPGITEAPGQGSRAGEAAPSEQPPLPRSGDERRHRIRSTGARPTTRAARPYHIVAIPHSYREYLGSSSRTKHALAFISMHIRGHYRAHKTTCIRPLCISRRAIPYRPDHHHEPCRRGTTANPA